VGSTFGTAPAGTYKYFWGISGTSLSTNTTGYTNISIRTSGTIWTSGSFAASSDSRIKEDIQILMMIVFYK